MTNHQHASATAPGSSDPAGNQDLARTLANVRRRWRWRQSLIYGALALVGLLLALLLLTKLWDALRFNAEYALALRLAALAVVALLLFIALRPWLRRRDARQLALYLEQRFPQLDAIALSALEYQVGDGGRERATIHHRLQARAAAACRAINHAATIDRRALAWGRYGALAALALVAITYWWQPAFLQHGLALLLGTTTPAQAAIYRLTVSPGDVEIARNSDQLIEATTLGFTPQVAHLILDPDSASPRRLPMQRLSARGDAGSRGQFEYFLFNITDPITYQVEADGLRSPRYRLAVVVVPTVHRIDLTYRYPDYSRRPPRRVENGGDISALQGSEVELQVAVTHPVAKATLVQDDQQRHPLTFNADQALWETTLTLAQSGHYFIELTSQQGRESRSRRYRIDVLLDQPPRVTIADPARDLKVTAIAEPAITLQANDDFGLEQLELVTTLNAEAPKVIDLLPVSARQESGGATTLTVDHALLLEELGLAPGDVISYYARARDRRDEENSLTTTDLFFLEIRPFERVFRAGQGGGGQGGGDFLDGALSSQQRQLVVALFNLIRDQESYRPEAYRQTIETLARSQERIRQRVEAIVRRIQARLMINTEENYKIMAEAMAEAAQTMITVETHLAEEAPAKAQSPARSALQSLLRAEAAFREVQISRSQSGQGGSASNAEELANLFKLELDKLRNSYETVQRGQQRAPEQALDDILKALEALAERQQRSAERGSDPQRQQQLADAAEELARRLERLTREEPPPPSQSSQGTWNRNSGQSQARGQRSGSSAQAANAERIEAVRQRLQAAAEAMRNAEAGDGEGAAEAQRRAIEELLAAREALANRQRDQFEAELASAQAQAEALSQRQRELAAETTELVKERERFSNQGQASGPNDYSQLDLNTWRVIDDKNHLAEEVERLSQQLQRMTRDGEEIDEGVAERLQGAITALENEGIADRLRASRDTMRYRTSSFTEALEERISEGLAATNEELKAALVAQSQAAEQDQLDDALTRLRQMVQELESMRQALAYNDLGPNRPSQARGNGEGQRSGRGSEEAQANGDRPGNSQPGQRGEEAQANGGQGDGRPGESQGQGQVGRGNQPGQRGTAPGQGEGEGVANSEAPSHRQGDSQLPGRAPSPGGAVGGLAAGEQWGIDGESAGGGRRYGRQQISEWRRSLDQLGRGLSELNRDAKPIDSVLSALAQLEGSLTNGDQSALEPLQQQVIDPLKALEFALREGESPLPSSAPRKPVPLAYDELVEEYFRNLSRTQSP